MGEANPKPFEVAKDKGAGAGATATCTNAGAEDAASTSML